MYACLCVIDQLCTVLITNERRLVCMCMCVCVYTDLTAYDRRLVRAVRVLSSVRVNSAVRIVRVQILTSHMHD